MTENNLKPYIIGSKIALYDVSTKKFLVLKANKPEGKKFETFWKTYFPYDLPGGRIENGETVEEGFLRDVREEIGEAVQFMQSDIVHAEQMEYIDAAVYAVFSLGYYQGGEITLSDEHSEYHWFTAEEVASHQEIKPWLKSAVAQAEKRIQEISYLEDLKRSQADFENYKRRQAESQKELTGYLTEKIVRDITPVLDNFYQALAFVPEDQKESSWITGITYIQKQLLDALMAHGLTEITVRVGDAFDPNIHEAIESEGEDGSKISKVLQPGYKIGERVIKPAKVRVS
jgi:molecular chaperone GrpE